MERTTLADLSSDPSSDRPAVIPEPDGVATTYRALFEQVERTASRLRAAGLRPGDAVALVLTNGLEPIVLFLALARARLIAAPLNPASKPDELRRFFRDVEPRAIVMAAEDERRQSIATDLPVPVWAATLDTRGTTLELAGLPTGSEARSPEPPEPGDLALYLHTSGTEGRAKVVALTHANVLAAAEHVASHYALTPEDRSLLVMPLFHGHGLVGAALATLGSGGALIVPPRFSASRFWASITRRRATWYTAVPTIHEILLERADADGAPPESVRFIRSCSEALAPAVLARMERRFGAPVLEAYGLTEACHQVASNPLPPRARKPGSVGFGVGTEIAIIDAGARRCPAGTPGEVILSGPSVMQGYRGDPAATSEAFVDGWLRTGDLGVLDVNGYLTLTGRLKELINRGGEKISPAEIDAVLLAHPAVVEAAAFGVPDAKYGEALEAAVVLKGATDPEQLRAFCRARLADFKVPGVIWIVPALPKNPAGKVERTALARRYESSRTSFQARTLDPAQEQS